MIRESGNLQWCPGTKPMMAARERSPRKTGLGSWTILLLWQPKFPPNFANIAARSEDKGDDHHPVEHYRLQWASRDTDGDQIKRSGERNANIMYVVRLLAVMCDVAAQPKTTFIVPAESLNGVRWTRNFHFYAFPIPNIVGKSIMLSGFPSLVSFVPSFIRSDM